MQRKIFTYPRSFLRFILLSYGLVSLPILIAAVYATASMSTLSRQNARAVQEASQSSHLERDLMSRLTEMERGLRQYAVLGDPGLVAEFRGNGEEFARLLREFVALHPVVDGAEEPLYRLNQEIIDAIGTAPDSRASTLRVGQQDAMDALEQLKLALPGVIFKVNQGISAEIDSNKTLASSAQVSLLFSLLFSLLAAALIVLLFRRLIGAQLRQFERAVEMLGTGHHSEEIHFSGPQDIRFLGEQLEWLRLRLQELGTQRHRFLRNVSHDLKTPLTILREGTQLLADGVSGTLNEQQRNIVNMMNEHSGRLQRMIEDLLRAQQASLAIAGITPQATRLDLICKQVVKDHRLLTEKRRIDLRTDLPEVTMEGVGDQLHKVIDNLVSNAIKFSPEGGQIRVGLKVTENTVAFTISDEGPGIPEKEKELIFEPFFRGAFTRSMRVEGSGVGLAISRDFVTAHGGTLNVLPATRGACLQVRLPLRQPHLVGGDKAHA